MDTKENEYKSPEQLMIEAVEHKMDEEFRKFAKRMDHFAEKVQAYDPKNMLEMEERHATLSERMQLLIEKITVVTEIGYHARRSILVSDVKRATLLAAAICALDEPDKWWKGHNDMSVKDWAKRCLTAYLSNKQSKK